MSHVYETFEHAGLLVEIVHDDDAYSLNPRDCFGDELGTMIFWGPSVRHYSLGGQNDITLGEYDDFEIACPACDGDGTLDDTEEVRHYSGFGYTVEFGPATMAECEAYVESQTDKDKVLSIDNGGCTKCEGTGMVEASPEEYLRAEYDADVILPLRFEDYGSSGNRIRPAEFEREGDDTLRQALRANGAMILTKQEREIEFLAAQSDDELREILLAHVDEYDAWGRGDVYGYIVKEGDEDDPGETLDSCWGFIETDIFDAKESYVFTAAKEAAESCASYIAKEKGEAEYWRARDVETVTA